MKSNRKKLIFWIIAIIVIVVAGSMAIVSLSGKKEVKLNIATAEQKTIELTVMATGYVQPVDKVDVGTQVSGVIEKIYVDFNSDVKQGDLLAELDKQTLREKVVQAKASLASALSDRNLAQTNHDRSKRLYEAGAATKVAYEEAVNKLAQAETSYANAKANLQQADVNFGYAEIRSPIDGVILDRAVNTGQTVASSFNTPTLFTIAKDLTKMQVEADIDEADIGRIDIGQKVRFSVDAYYTDTFEGTVSQIRLQPTVTSNVVTYTVIIEAPNPDQKLFPGMTANITIITDSESGITVPLEAINFNPTPEISKLLGIGSEEKDQASANKNPQSGNQTAKPSGRNSGNSEINGSMANDAGSSKKSAVWVKDSTSIMRHPITTGINDGVDVIVASGLEEGRQVILSASLDNKKTQGKPTSLMPSPSRGGSRR